MEEKNEVQNVENINASADESEKIVLLSKEVKELEMQLASKPDAVAKLQWILDFMAQALAQPQTPQFKRFWEAKALCLTFFKESLSSSVRPLLWARYQELTQEARRLKQLFDEQTSFAVEQIDGAIKALEKDLLEKAVLAVDEASIPSTSLALQKNLSVYRSIQSELNLLNAYAVKINALRKELIKTEMRISQKNKFFQRLSVIGEKVFPKRKELIGKVSELFTQDVDLFVKNYFTEELPSTPLYKIREEIKTLQAAAKYLTLNTSGFARARGSLSSCWDKLKVMEKELKKSHAEKKEGDRKISQDVLQQITQIKESYETQELLLSDARHKLEAISQELRKIEIGRAEVALLREALMEVLHPLKEKEEKERQRIQDFAKEKERARRETYQRLRKEIDELRKIKDQEQLESLKSRIDAVIQQIGSPPLTPSEIHDLKQQLKTIEDAFKDRLEFQQLAFCGDKGEEMKKLLEILNLWKMRRHEVKAQLERHRKNSGISGLDFEQSLKRQEELLQEKERLEQLDRGIQDLERKISSLTHLTQKKGA